MTTNILVIEDDDHVRNSIVQLLEAYGFGVAAVNCLKDARQKMEGIDVVLSDWDLGLYDTRNGGEIVTELRREHPNVRYIIWSGIDRSVPDGVEFYSKGDLTLVLNTLRQS